MKNLLVFSIICCVIVVYGSQPVQHNLFYGSCAPDNETIPIYTQVIIMDNSNDVHAVAKPTRKWYNWFSNISFGHRRTTTTAAPNTSGKVINATVVFPPLVSQDN